MKKCCNELKEKVCALERKTFNREQDEEWNSLLADESIYEVAEKDKYLDTGDRVMWTIKDHPYEKEFIISRHEQKHDSTTVTTVGFCVDKTVLVGNLHLLPALVIGFLAGILASIIVGVLL